MICCYVTKSVEDLNIEVASDGFSDSLSPCTLVTGRINPSYKEIQALNFGDYVQAHVPRHKTNGNEPRTIGCIALYPSRNAHESWYFISLDTGERVLMYS